jgi:hypothetical protein
LIRATFIPLSMRARIISGLSEAGPIVQTILVRFIAVDLDPL